jgi:uncharacterized membrane protein
MIYENELIIDIPRDRVVELMDNFENLKKWQPGLRSYEHLSGEPGQTGAVTKLIYDEKGREVEMTETIVTRNFPDEFTAIYKGKDVVNRFENYFYEEGPNKTRWRTVSDFKFHGFMSIFALFMRRAFPKQTLKDMERFKTFAEGA